MVLTETTSRCQVDVSDVQSQADGKFQLILAY